MKNENSIILISKEEVEKNFSLEDSMKAIEKSYLSFKQKTVTQPLRNAMFLNDNRTSLLGMVRSKKKKQKKN